MKRDFLAITDFTTEEIQEVFSLAGRLKENPSKGSGVLKEATVACIFHKPSLRTRISFETGIHELGGNSLYVTEKEIQLGVRESIYDAAKVLSRYVGMIVIRTFEQSDVEQLGKHAEVPVINGLTDLLHPCQVMGDVFTVLEKKGRLKDMKIAYLGDGNNVCSSWLNASTRFPLDLRIGTARGTEPNPEILERARSAGLSKINIYYEPETAIADADVVYTDVWASMGQKDLAQERAKLLSSFRVNHQLLSKAASDCIVMHCLPANRGEEITDEVMDGPHSVVFDQAENRLHVQKAIMMTLIGKGNA
ncbi:MAG: ornithine carbamoyltransferase [Candidatus Zixiibacteriota bacterium]